MLKKETTNTFNKVFSVRVIRYFSLLFFVFLIPANVFSWGFHAHRTMNRHAVFCLPPEMAYFYKKHLEYITEHSVDPDKISRVNPDEAPRHYIDIDHYGENAFEKMPENWDEAVKIFKEDTLKKHGVLPWHIPVVFNRLVNAFIEENVTQIIRLSAHLGHYVADALTPLHTTKYYNGRTPAERGIHAFWETRIPVLFSERYNFFVGRATYIEDPAKKAWELIRYSHSQVDTIYKIYEFLIDSLPPDRHFMYDSRGFSTGRNFSRDFALYFEKISNNMVERNMRKTIYYIASYWYTAWVNAGQPNLRKLSDKDSIKKLKEEQKELERLWRSGKPKGRPNPEDEEVL